MCLLVFLSLKHLLTFSSVHYEMPKSTHIHKSMLLRGVKFPPPALNQGDIEKTKGKAAVSGRNHGGVPLRGDGRGRNSFNYSSQNQYSSAPSHQQSYGSQNGYSNNNSYSTPPTGWQPPPPGVGGFARGPPPPPPSAYGSYGRGQPPPPYQQLSSNYGSQSGYGPPGGPPGHSGANNDRRRGGGGDGYRGRRNH